MWKEQFNQRLDNAIKYDWTGGFDRKFLINFISTEIIEKLIDDIPETMNVLLRSDIENGVPLDGLKQQLKERWL